MMDKFRKAVTGGASETLKKAAPAPTPKADKGLRGGFSGVVEPPLPPDEPIHRGLARGALAKASKAYREGEIGAAEFGKHIKVAHGRLQDPMHMPAMPMATKSAPERHTNRSRHHRKKGPRGGI